MTALQGWPSRKTSSQKLSGPNLPSDASSTDHKSGNLSTGAMSYVKLMLTTVVVRYEACQSCELCSLMCLLSLVGKQGTFCELQTCTLLQRH